MYSSVAFEAPTTSSVDASLSIPQWSRLNKRNADGVPRSAAQAKYKNFNIEIGNWLWSIWGNLHPEAPCFENALRGKQYLACNVLACCAAAVYTPHQWNPELLDTIVISGNEYYRRSLTKLSTKQYLTLQQLCKSCPLGDFTLRVCFEYVTYGYLGVARNLYRMNLATALTFFLQSYEFGILECKSRSLAFGRTAAHGGYFMYDCGSSGHPIFPRNEGASYLLYTHELLFLIYCMGSTLNMPQGTEFHIHRVEVL